MFFSAIIGSIYYIFTYYIRKLEFKEANILRKHTLSVLVKNHMGVLSRVSGLFSRRGYNIDSLSVGMTEDKDISRMTIVVECEDDVFDQIKNQLGKLVDVVSIYEFDDSILVKRELAMIKICAPEEKRSQVLEIVNIFRGKVIDVNDSSMIIETTGDMEKVSALVKMLEHFGIKEVIRTGIAALARGNEELKNIEY
jgi:acetolactate synthase-1/3 small subunit